MEQRVRAVEVLVTAPDRGFWSNRRVFVTGHTGFKGGWLALALARMDAKVRGYALSPETRPNLYDALDLDTVIDSRIGDLRDAAGLRDSLIAHDPDIVFHLAAQPLVRASYADPAATFAVNVQGTVNVLEAVREAPGVRAMVVVTTDKVYRNDDSGQAFVEDDPLGGRDPYSASKAAAEIVAASYRDSFLAARGTAVATARAGNVVGGGDWSADRLLPDAVRAWEARATLAIRHPEATRPWQHVAEPVFAYLRLAEAIHADPDRAAAYNFGPAAGAGATVRDVIERARTIWPGDVAYAARAEGPHEAELLSLDPRRAAERLGVHPCWGLDETIARTINWYRRFAAGDCARALCEADFAALERCA